MFAGAGSICAINGYLLVYTKKPNLNFHNSDDAVKVEALLLPLLNFALGLVISIGI